MSAIKLSVIIPTFNRLRALERTVPALLAQDLPAPEYELIFVVDGSTDGTLEMLRALKPACGLRILEQKNRGPAAARNAGIQAAQGELVLFLDDDIVCGPDLLRRHVEAHAGRGHLVVHGPIFVDPGSPATLIRYATEDWYKLYYDSIAARGDLSLPRDFFLISNSSVPRSLLLAAGGFDEFIPAHEDFDLGIRLANLGARFHYDAKAVAHELFVKSTHDFLASDCRRLGRAEVLLCRKHPHYRPYSWLATSAETSRLKRLGLRFPFTLTCVGLPLWIAEKLDLRRLGIRLMQLARRVVSERAAMREAGSWRALRREFGTKLPVLMYHHVGPQRPGTIPSLTVTPEAFEWQMRWLAHHGYTCIRPADWLRWCKEGSALPEKPVLLTFDDGYADLVEFALPVLKRNGFGAVVYVVTQRATNTWDEARGSATHRLMTLEQIREWAAHGIDFGAHSRSHADLTQLTPAELHGEVAGSGDDLRQALGSRVPSFAYPFCFYNDDVRRCVSEHFALAVTCAEGLNTLATDLFTLRRTMVQPGDTRFDFAARVRRGWSPLEHLRRRTRLRSRLRDASRSLLGQRA